jgi:hypothetical protein
MAKGDVSNKGSLARCRLVGGRMGNGGPVRVGAGRARWRMGP